MDTPQTPTVDVRAPNGGRIVLQPVIRLDRLPGLSRNAVAAVVALCAVFLATSFNRLNHTDLWGHLNFGRWIVEHGTLPGSDPFRPGIPSEHFQNFYWLGQVLGYGWHQAFGLEGLVLAHGGLITLTAVCLMLAVRGRRVSLGWAVTAAVTAYALALPITGTIRPQLFGMLGFAATLWAIARLPSRNHPLVWLPMLFALWANLHGSFAMGLVVLGCYCLGHTWMTAQTADRLADLARDRAVRRAWLALLLATGASCLNPSGPGLLVAVAGFAGNGNLEGISEWRPMVLGSLSGGLFFASLLVTAVLLRWSPRRVSATEVLLILVFALASLVAIRMLVWWALVWPWVVAPHAAATWLLYRRSTPIDDFDDRESRAARARRMLLAAAICFAALWWSPPTFGLFSGRPRPDEAVLSANTPKGLAEAVKAKGLQGQIFAPLDWADYLVWQTGAKVEPLVYSHVHLTSPEVWRDFLRLRAGDNAWLTVADRYGLDYLAIDRERNGRLAARATSHPRCRVLYEDGQGLLVEIVGR